MPIAPTDARFTFIRFRNYKALKSYSLGLQHFNVLVGPNNSGKSTVLGALRILAEGIRKARTRSPELVRVGKETQFGLRISLEGLPVSTENIFTNYDDGAPASVSFRLSNKNELELYFPEVGTCYLLCRTTGKPVRTPTDFKREYPISVGFVPVLGPVEHEEQLYQAEAAKRALMTHGASRNFRNIWYHFSEKFDEFRKLIQTTWPGMDIERPKIRHGSGKSQLLMFCPEQRYPREIYWAGFGFQVWCQMLTYLLQSKGDSLLVIDEPDIYLHSDLQRQLLGILEDLGPDILLATHSTEIISECEPASLLVVNKKSNSARRMQNSAQIDLVLRALGSNLNPTLTQLAKTRRALFLEGKDFQILSAFAKNFGFEALSTRADFAVVPLEGFNPQKVDSIAKGIELTLGAKIQRAIVLDRDYRLPDEISEVTRQLQSTCSVVHVHDMKELENYLLRPNALLAAIRRRCVEREKRIGESCVFSEDVRSLLEKITASMKLEIGSQFVTRYAASQRRLVPSIDPSTANMFAMSEFDKCWGDFENRLMIVPGKRVLSDLNSYLQATYHVTVTPLAIVAAMMRDELATSMSFLLAELDRFRRSNVES